MRIREKGNMKTALITGITGQDGRHLAELLVAKGYHVFGLVNGQRHLKTMEFAFSSPEVELIQGDLSDSTSLRRALSLSSPDEIYNLGAISFVGLSFSQPELTADVTGLGILRLLESCRSLGIEDKVKIYQASSSEMFGQVRETPQNEKTPFHPRSPYGVAKTFAHYTAVNYREAYGMFITNGILFNHEGEYRGYEFVTRKISQGVARIRLGLSGELRLGSLTPRRDWGYARDYVEAMWMMLQHETPNDFVIATGKTHSVYDFVTAAFTAAGMEGEHQKYIVSDPNLFRPSEVEELQGDPSKAKKVLGWEAKTTFQELVQIMVDNDLRIEASRADLKLP